jgi:hypothetical protein
MPVTVTLNNVANLQSTTTAQNTINSNNTAIVTGFGNVVNVAGDKMLGTLDMNSQQILNLPAPATLDSPVRLVDVAAGGSATIASIPPTGTSGTVVGFLNGNLTFSGTDTFSGPVTFSSAVTFTMVSGITGFIPITSTATVVGAPAIWSNTAGSAIITGGDPINVKAYGAVGNGIADDTAAIQNAWNASVSGLIYLPPGTYLVSSTLKGPNLNGAGIIGAGAYSTIIKANFTTGDVILSYTTINHPVFKGMTITRTSAASSGAGLNMNTSCADARIEDLFLNNHFDGLHVQNTDQSYITNVRSTNNTRNGFYLDGQSGGALQWDLLNCLAQTNGNIGFAIIGLGSTAVGQYRGLSTYQNTSYGFYASGVAALRVSDCFFGSDGLSEVVVTLCTNVDYGHLFTNVYTEVSAAGAGFDFINTNSSPVALVNCGAVFNYLSGVLWNSPNTLVVNGGCYDNNGFGSVSGNLYGIYAINGNASITGANVYLNQTFNVVATSGATSISIIGCHTGVPSTFISLANSGTTYTAGNF